MSNISLIDILAFLGGILLSGCLIPQIYKTYKTKDVENISIYWQVLYIIGLSMSTIYMFVNKLYPILIPNLIELFFIILLTIMKIAYHKKKINSNSIRYNVCVSEI